jgi:hypothetical protein
VENQFAASYSSFIYKLDYKVTFLAVVRLTGPCVNSTTHWCNRDWIVGMDGRDIPIDLLGLDWHKHMWEIFIRYCKTFLMSGLIDAFGWGVTYTLHTSKYRAFWVQLIDK